MYGSNVLKDWIDRRLLSEAVKKTNSGYCPVCCSETIFIENDPWLRDHYRCTKCNSIPRERALMYVMDTLLPEWPRMKIHESSPGTVNSEYISKRCGDYSYSHYFPDITCGSHRDGVRCENIERLTFEDLSFDLFITQDVLEHVMRPDKAFLEIARALRPNGAHVFTVPLYKDLRESRPRVEAVGDDIRYLLEPVYHGNPIDAKGSLVTWDYGQDLPELIFEHSGLYTTVYCIQDRSRGMDGEFLEVFVSRKIPGRQ